MRKSIPVLAIAALSAVFSQAKADPITTDSIETRRFDVRGTITGPSSIDTTTNTIAPFNATASETYTPPLHSPTFNEPNGIDRSFSATPIKTNGLSSFPQNSMETLHLAPTTRGGPETSSFYDLDWRYDLYDRNEEVDWVDWLESSLDVVGVPELCILTLVGTGFLAFGALRLRRRRRAVPTTQP
jgi:hypothetical protein